MGFGDLKPVLTSPLELDLAKLARKSSEQKQWFELGREIRSYFLHTSSSVPSAFLNLGLSGDQ